MISSTISDELRPKSRESPPGTQARCKIIVPEVELLWSVKKASRVKVKEVEGQPPNSKKSLKSLSPSLDCKIGLHSFTEAIIYPHSASLDDSKVFRHTARTLRSECIMEILCLLDSVKGIFWERTDHPDCFS